MIIDVAAELDGVDFAPGSALEEVLQNVKTILTTRKGSVPMDRAFGIDGDVVDLPSAVAQARLSSEIVSAVAKYEPRARVERVFYEGSEEEGLLRAKVRVSIDAT